MDFKLAIPHANTLKIKFKVSLSLSRGGSRTFSGEGGGFSKKKMKILSTFFLGGPN